MNQIHLKDAFGETPESIKACVQRSLHTRNRRICMKRKLSVSLVAAAIIVAMMSVVAFAAARLGVIDLFSYHDTVNEAASQGVQPLNAVYKGEYVRLTLLDGLYDADGGTYSLSWTLENLRNETGLYPLFDGITFGGEKTHVRSGYVFDSTLPSGITEYLSLGELPANDSCEGVISFRILQAASPEVDVQYLLDTMSTDLPTLLSDGHCQVVEEISLPFTLSPDALPASALAYTGETAFVFDTCELRITRAEVSATAVYITVQYITPEPPADGGKGWGPMWSVKFAVPGMDIWYGNGSGTFSEEPVLMEDGRYLSEYSFEAVGLFTRPDTLEMTLVTYDSDFQPTYHTENSVTLTFQ